MFMYSVFGMSQFSFLEHKAGITDVLNFETFQRSLFLLFEVSTSAGWDQFLEPMLYSSEPDCRPYTNNTQASNTTFEYNGPTCNPNKGIAYLYLISYLLITFIIVTNMYIAIILENFDLATKEQDEPLTADDFEHFFDIWQAYDLKGSGYVSLPTFSNMLTTMDEPFKRPYPNIDFIIGLDMPLFGSVQEGYQVYILDVISILAANIHTVETKMSILKC